MFGLGSQEILFIVFVIILLFGATKLPELARSMGRSMGEFKKGQMEVEREVQSSLVGGSRPVELTRVQRMAQTLSIDIVGKSEDTLLVEIEKKLDERQRTAVK